MLQNVVDRPCRSSSKLTPFETYWEPQKNNSWRWKYTQPEKNKQRTLWGKDTDENKNGVPMHTRVRIQSHWENLVWKILKTPETKINLWIKEIHGV